MRILANESFPGDAVAALRARGHDVAWVRSDAPGSSDAEVLARAQAEDRILITFDKDFGELAFRSGLPVSSGVVLFRISVPSSSHIARVAVAALESRTDWVGCFAGVEDDRIRMTPLPERLVLSPRHSQGGGHSNRRKVEWRWPAVRDAGVFTLCDRRGQYDRG